MEQYIKEEEIGWGDCILHNQEGVDIIPSNIELSSMEMILTNVMSRESILKGCLNELKAEKQINPNLQIDGILLTLVDTRTNLAKKTARTMNVKFVPLPLEIVKSVYFKLDKFTVEYVLDSLSACETKAHNIRAVILTALYNATMTIRNYYTNLVNYNEAGMC